jgi:hypothetical protein
MVSSVRYELRFYTWVISKVLHTVRFLFKNEFIFKISLQAFNVISIVLYHSGPTFGQVLYSCQDAFAVDASDYSGHLIRHLLNASETFPTEWFLQFLEQAKSGGLISGLYGGWGST